MLSYPTKKGLYTIDVESILGAGVRVNEVWLAGIGKKTVTEGGITYFDR